MPAAQEQERRHAGDRHHVGVLGHEERRELHAGVFHVKPCDQLILGFRKVEWNSIGFGESGDQEQNETEDLRERHLKDGPPRNESEVEARLTVGDFP